MRIITLLCALVLAGCAFGGGSSFSTSYEGQKSEPAQIDRGDFSRVDQYLRMPVVMTKPSPTAVVIPVVVTHYSCSEEEGTAACVEYHTGERPRDGTLASNDLLKGTKLWINGELGEVRDKGNLAKGQIDKYVGSREEAFRLGVIRTTAVIERER